MDKYIDLQKDGAHDQMMEILPEGWTYKVMCAGRCVMLLICNIEGDEYSFGIDGDNCSKVPKESLRAFVCGLKAGLSKW